MDDRALILTGRFDAPLFARLDQYRKQYFPPARNFLPAHVTLFHHLPGSQLDLTRKHLLTDALIESIPCSFPSIRFTGRGMHAVMQCEPLKAIRNSFAQHWQPWLTPQDQQPFRPHVTIQNKADPSEARRAFAQISQSWLPLTGNIVGLDLWHYAGGPWEPAGHFPLPMLIA